MHYTSAWLDDEEFVQQTHTYLKLNFDDGRIEGWIPSGWKNLIVSWPHLDLRWFNSQCDWLTTHGDDDDPWCTRATNSQPRFCAHAELHSIQGFAFCCSYNLWWVNYDEKGIEFIFTPFRDFVCKKDDDEEEDSDDGAVDEAILFSQFHPLCPLSASIFSTTWRQPLVLLNGLESETFVKK